MTPAPANNPGHQTAQGRPSEAPGFCHEPQGTCSDDNQSAATVLNALDALMGSFGESCMVVINHVLADVSDNNPIRALLVVNGEPAQATEGRTILEALTALVQ